MDLDYVLLGLIRMNPDVTGYELKGIINDSTGFFFPAHLSQIYPSLKKMTGNGWVVYSITTRETKPDLKRYRITDEGIEALEEWLVQPFDFQKTRSNYDMYFMKLIFMGHLPPDKTVKYIDSGIDHFTEHLADIKAENLQHETGFISVAEQDVHDRYMVLWSNEFDFIIREMEARIDWLKELRAQL